MNGLIEELKRTDAEVHFDDVHKRIYSVDASIFEIVPLGIAIPKTKEALVHILKIAKKHKIAVIARGAATGIAGGCIGKALILDLSKYLNTILSVNIEEEYAWIEPGVIQDQLNFSLDPFHYRLGPDTSTGNRATIGGMAANDSAGARSLYYGKMDQHLLEVELALASGELVRFKSLTIEEFEKKKEQEDTEGGIYKKIAEILIQYDEEIKTGFPKIPRRVSGYNLDLIQSGNQINICRLIAGSEGTLGIITEMKVKICKKPKQTGVAIIHFHKMEEGMSAIPFLLNFSPIALEMIDRIILKTGLNHLKKGEKLEWLINDPYMVFVAEFAGESGQEVQEKLKKFTEALLKEKIGYATICLNEQEEVTRVWNLRKAGLGLLLSKKSYNRAIAFIEDLSIPPSRLGPFMKKFQAYMESIGKTAGIYGHVGSGCMHIRPYIDLRKQEEVEVMKKIMLDVTDLVLEHKGALSGEHGDGLIRSWLTEKCFGKTLYQAFIKTKLAFDPENRMNPGKIVFGEFLLKNLRLEPETRFANIKTFLDFKEEGGFDLAVDLCNGNGLCRKKTGTMCPSFQATNDEYDTTRARAQSLRAIVNGHVPEENLESGPIQEVLDLCLECKACKTECPSHVDMAKLKAEALFQYQEKHGYLFRNRLFAFIGRINYLASPFACLFNFLSKTKFCKVFFNLLGISKNRNLPKLAKKRFSTLFKKEQQPKGKQALLFNDTFNEFNDPQIGIAALKVLNHLGYEVTIIPWECCGRPMISKGFLKQAKTQALKLYQKLLPFAQKQIPIIGLEPSCILAIKDDFASLIGKEKMEQITSCCFTFDAFIAKENLSRFKNFSEPVKVHGHCHQKSLVGMRPTLDIFKKLHIQAEEIPSGCCGMAGSFGYEKEHFDISMKIGNLKLFPAINAANDSLLIANGTSCRAQIQDGTGKKAQHLAEFLSDLI